MVALFVYEILSGEGFVPDRESGVAITWVAAAGYVAVQLGYLAFLRLVLPTRDYAPMLVESVGQLSACALLPFLLDMEIAWPIEALERFAMLVFLGVFVALHLGGKLVSFFAYTAGKPSGRIAGIAWAILAALSGNYAFDGFVEWRGTIDGIRPQVDVAEQPVRAGGVLLEGMALDEGSVITRDLAFIDNQSLTFRFARPSMAGVEGFTGDRIHIITYLDGDETERVVTEITLKDKGWTEYRIPAEAVPDDVRALRMWWSTRKESPFQRILGVNPVVLSSRKVLFSGPTTYVERVAEVRPNLVLIGIDGLGISNMSLSDADLKTTPNLDRLASSSAIQWFGGAYSPTIEANAGAYTLVTGRHPVTLLRGVETGHVLDPYGEARFATATFGSTEHSPDVPTWQDETRMNAGEMLDDVRKWIDIRQELGFAVAIRVRDLESDVAATKLGYENTLRDVDRQVSAFVKYIRDYDTRDNTIIVIAGTHGTLFDEGGNRVYPGLMDEALQIPLLFYVPGVSREERNDLVSLEDVMPTVMELSDLLTTARMDGRAFWRGPNGREPIAIGPEGEYFSLRTQEWRFIWAPNSGEPPELYDISRWGSRRGPRNVASRFGTVVRRQKAAIEDFMDVHGVPRIADPGT